MTAPPPPNLHRIAEAAFPGRGFDSEYDRCCAAWIIFAPHMDAVCPTPPGDLAACNLMLDAHRCLSSVLDHLREAERAESMRGTCRRRTAALLRHLEMELREYVAARITICPRPDIAGLGVDDVLRRVIGRCLAPGGHEIRSAPTSNGS